MISYIIYLGEQGTDPRMEDAPFSFGSIKLVMLSFYEWLILGRRLGVHSEVTKEFEFWRILALESTPIR
jgi:hypothetical protein